MCVDDNTLVSRVRGGVKYGRTLLVCDAYGLVLHDVFDTVSPECTTLRGPLSTDKLSMECTFHPRACVRPSEHCVLRWQLCNIFMCPGSVGRPRHKGWTLCLKGPTVTSTVPESRVAVPGPLRENHLSRPDSSDTLFVSFLALAHIP